MPRPPSTASSISAVSSRYVSRISASLPVPPEGSPGISATSRAPPVAGACTTWHSSWPSAEGGQRLVGADRRRRGDAVHPAQPLQAIAPRSRDSRFSPAEHPRHQADLREVLDRLHLVVRARRRRRPTVSAPWLASSMPSCALMYWRTASGSSSVDGVAYSAIGMLPSVVMTSASTARSSGMPATANPVAIGGCACTTALHVRPLPVDLEVHQQLGRGIALARELLARRDP